MVVKIATECLITLKGVSKAYQQPNGQQISILEPINLELRSGEIVALLGPSGSGKSTLMRMIAGLIPPSDGEVLYHNRPLVGLNPGIAIVFQNFALYPWLTVLENVELGLKAKGDLPEPRRQKALRMIDIIGLDGFENAYPKELSGGMRQRVGFARALAVEPELLCMDEPFSALDVLTAENLRFELLDLWLEKKIPTQAVLIVTHGIEEAVILADRIVVLGRNPGRIRAELTVTLPHYRDRKTPEFQALVDQVYKILTNPELSCETVAAPTQSTATAVSQTQPAPSTKYQSLPQVRTGAIAGLLELLEDRKEKDLYRLGQELMLEVDDILPIVEAAKLMEFLVIQEGDLLLTPVGIQFIAGGIDQRKQIVRTQILSNIRAVQQISRMLQSKRNHRISEELILDILEAHFSPQEAMRQLKTAIDWGRYAELYSYDEPGGEIFLESEEPKNE
ncbi:MAG: nitrate/sulfonate/bicarbonate ABC transporter ATP-binding protein [Microcoleus sp. PH2017_29_MFU_D_A]|uniref:ABC transporter ATP-binding protein n=1 Tax=unclassified Microcoleus TaxID=2642155 RepID=UPI001DD45309|nr:MULTISPECIES: nitrate/sulfonate/bicarbonate ABC transporter ATP-binding protein [unclassified Microcoleus]MCC3432410.1 nitrate/sulfonate/bicarbonate ABC transporter ATP-binding protein [Microcoleus sp. PH2017_04_SCI_O_A]MCC3444157.1 nitrate/sulfonate/bicarbonate ABC transporter ATP-binding protein [Microcoleus sp. PH2017_03_ELD_O_A]MCC3466338.1 nitrate/sulfonate/bicarbonate ABC transporter ATP-binding protein [Microcoleus sp. PH2017_06_SFM_O_A]MCC3503768.1 nitrate/sulfonate/bicarbonate ABC t